MTQRAARGAVRASCASCHVGSHSASEQLLSIFIWIKLDERIASVLLRGAPPRNANCQNVSPLFFTCRLLLA